MINLNDFIDVLEDRDVFEFLVSDEKIMYSGGKLKSNVLKLNYKELKSVLSNLSDPEISNISVKRVDFDTDEYGGKRKLFLVVTDKKLKELQLLNEKRLIKIAQINSQLEDLQKQLLFL